MASSLLTQAMAEDEDQTEFLRAMQVVAAVAIQPTLKAVLELGVLDIMSKAGPEQLSATEIASRLPATNNPQAAVVLDRMLGYLASQSVLTCAVDDGGTGRRRYALAPMCKFLTENRDGVSLVPLLLMYQERSHRDCWQELKHAVLDGTDPFAKANGATNYDYNQTHPRVNQAFNHGMSDLSALVVKKMLDVYAGFEGVRELVDVGGGLGIAVHMIVSKYPNIRGVNFDQQQVISTAPPLSGVDHIVGDMFESVPRGDAIFMQRVLHNWTYEDCLKILRNCLEALPSSGKVIIFEPTVPEVPDTSDRTKAAMYFDLCMLAKTGVGRERTTKEFESMAKEAGFSGFRVACVAYFMTVMELIK